MRNFLSNRTGKALLALALIFGTTGLLIYFQQIAAIYILSTLGLIILLLVVAFADLEKVGQAARKEAHLNDFDDESAALAKMRAVHSTGRARSKTDT